MTLYDLTVKQVGGGDKSLADYKGKVLLIVNTATGCGFTPQYEGLQDLYEKYQDQGFEVLDFPCNQFFAQAPGDDEEIASFCTSNYGTTFPRFQKIDVNGEHAAPLFVYLRGQAQEVESAEASALVQQLAQYGHTVQGDEIKWNFTKFLVDREGNVVGRFAPTDAPEALAGKIEQLL